MEHLAWTLSHHIDERWVRGGHHLGMPNGAQTNSFSSLNRGNPRTRLSLLKRDKRSKLKWPNFLCHFHNSLDEPAKKQRSTPEDWEKLARNTWPSRTTLQTRSPRESKIWEPLGWM
jgi:hypothetical protein